VSSSRPIAGRTDVQAQRTSTLPLFPESLAEAHFRLLAEQLPVFFWTTDARLIITSHGGRGFQRCKRPQCSAIGRHIADYFRCRNFALTAR
jgi:hypothetical protein